MPSKKIGGRPPRYSFILNPYTDVRVSKCPRCDRPTYARKFALFIHVDGFGPIVLGKTCRYCSRCELIVAYQDELEAQLAQGPAALKPATGGYLVIGTMDKKTWEKGLHGGGATLQQVADFKKLLTLHVEGGWGPPDAAAIRTAAPHESQVRLMDMGSGESRRIPATAAGYYRLDIGCAPGFGQDIGSPGAGLTGWHWGGTQKAPAEPRPSVAARRPTAIMPVVSAKTKLDHRVLSPSARSRLDLGVACSPGSS